MLVLHLQGSGYKVQHCKRKIKNLPDYMHDNPVYMFQKLLFKSMFELSFYFLVKQHHLWN